MKPLSAAPLTFLDSAIWLHVAARFSLDYPLRLDLVSGDVDRRDAELMLNYEQGKADYIASAGVFAYCRARAAGHDLARRAIK